MVQLQGTTTRARCKVPKSMILILTSVLWQLRSNGFFSVAYSAHTEGSNPGARRICPAHGHRGKKVADSMNTASKYSDFAGARTRSARFRVRDFTTTLTRHDFTPTCVCTRACVMHAWARTCMCVCLGNNIWTVQIRFARVSTYHHIQCWRFDHDTLYRRETLQT